MHGRSAPHQPDNELLNAIVDNLSSPEVQVSMYYIYVLYTTVHDMYMYSEYMYMHT